MSLGLTGATVVTSLDPAHLVQADVMIQDGKILEVGRARTATPRRDCSGCLILPGNVCAHTHLYSSLARGMPFRLPAPENFLQILQRVWWRLDRALDERSIRASALVGGMDALLAGTTTIVDHHASPNAIDGSLDIIADALDALGLRSVLCYEVTDRDGPDRARAGLEENRRFLASTRSRARGLVGAHASFTLSADTLAACVELARVAGSGIHIHVAEDAADQRDAQWRFGQRVVHRLATAGALSDRTLVAHCVHVDDTEAAALVRRGVAIAHNARSNMNNAVGRAPVRRLGRRVVLGTDGLGGDMFTESSIAYWRAREDDIALGVTWPLERLAAGARLVGDLFKEPLLGRIEPGAPADLTVLEYVPPTSISDQNLAGHWMFGCSARHVRDVLVSGEFVVRDRRLSRIDQDELVTDAVAEAQRLWGHVDEIGPHAFAPAEAQ